LQEATPGKKLYYIIRGKGLYTSFENDFRYGNEFDLTHPPLGFRDWGLGFAFSHGFAARV